MTPPNPTEITAFNAAQISAQETLLDLCAAWEKLSPPEKEPTVEIVPEAYDETDLFEVCRHGNLPVLKTLIEQGVDIHADTEYALRGAANKGHIEVVRLLLAHNADVHADNDGALRWAAKNGYLEIVNLLLAQGADIHASDEYALRWAAHKGHIEIVRLLLAQDADIHAENDFALKWAANYGQLEIVRLLLAHNADIHADGDQALQMAVEGGHRDVVRLLLQNGALIEKLTPEQREIYDEQVNVFKNKVQAEKKLTEIFNPAVWLERKPEMLALWSQVPEDLKSGFDFSHVVSEVSVHSLKQGHRKRIVLVK